MPLKPPLISLGVISSAALAYEILLMRLFSIIQWHHFAYMIISLALLGYGISGTLISLLQTAQVDKEQNTTRSWFQFVYPLTLFLFSLASFFCFLLAQNIPFNPEAMLWDSQQIWYFLSIFLLLSIPFLLAASAICLIFIHYPKHIASIYSIDLIGAGIGSLGIILILFYIFPMTALLVISLLGLLATIIALKELHLLASPFFRRGIEGVANQQIPPPQPESKNKTIYVWILTLFIFLTALLLVSTAQHSQLDISIYKGLSRTLNIKDTQVIAQRSSPMGLLSIVESPELPFRHAPGLSLHNLQEPPEQLGLFSDAANMTVISRYPEDLKKLSYLDKLTSALPYHLNTIDTLLIVGAGGGSDILQGLYYDTEKIDALEINPQIIDLLSDEFSNYSGNIYLKDNVNVYAEDIRGFLSKKNKDPDSSYNLIQLSLMDSFNASASGLYGMHESYLYTVEALQSYLQHLNKEGYLAISRWVKTPPRDAIKMFATAIEALDNIQFQNMDIQDIKNHLILIRGWQTSTLLIKKSPFNESEIIKLKHFCKERAFDVAWYPGITVNETNQHNRFREAWFFQAANALLTPDLKQHFLQNYKYAIHPATDNKPFFHQFFKWSALTELLSLREQGGFALVEMGYIILLATLILAVLSSIILIILPLVVFYFRSKKQPGYSLSVLGQTQLFIYFFAIGLAFLFIEIAMMQKFILFLHHPIYAIPVVLSSFLIFSGLGSAWTKRLLSHLSNRQLLFYAILFIIGFGLLYSYFLSSFFTVMAAQSIAVKVVMSLIVIAPLAVFMGMPFPIALATLGASNKNYIPWAWGINGCASVISAVLASLLAIHFGFNQVILFGMGLYLVCLVVFIVPGNKTMNP